MRFDAKLPGLPPASQGFTFRREDLHAVVPRIGHIDIAIRPDCHAVWTVQKRQRALFREAAARGEGRVVILASDSPHTSVATIAAAFAALERADLVIGPVRDGGYYLLGMRGWHDVLRDVAMSTGSVAREIAAAAARAGLSLAQVETTFDVDEVYDLRQLRELVATRDDLPATRAILETVPEQLVPGTG